MSTRRPAVRDDVPPYAFDERQVTLAATESKSDIMASRLVPARGGPRGRRADTQIVT